MCNSKLAIGEGASTAAAFAANADLAGEPPWSARTGSRLHWGDMSPHSKRVGGRGAI